MHGPTGIFWANLTPFSLKSPEFLGPRIGDKILFGGEYFKRGMLPFLYSSPQPSAGLS